MRFRVDDQGQVSAYHFYRNGKISFGWVMTLEDVSSFALRGADGQLWLTMGKSGDKPPSLTVIDKGRPIGSLGEK